MNSSNSNPAPFPRNSPLLILPSVPCDVITTVSPASFTASSMSNTGGVGPGGSQATQKTVKRSFTLRLFRSGEGETGKGLRFEMTDEGDGATCESTAFEAAEARNEGDESDTSDSSTTPPSPPPPPPVVSDEVTLYTLEVYEDDFHLLKSSQSLLVDFSDFPTMLQSVLKSCSSGEYTARLEEGSHGSCTLSVVEPSRFKELTHLSLQVCKCNDREIRPYLSARVNELTEKYREALRKDEEGGRVRKGMEKEIRELKEDISKERLERESVVRTVRLEMGEKGREVEIENQRKARDMVEQKRREFEEKEEEMRREIKKFQEKIEIVMDEREKAVADKVRGKGKQDKSVRCRALVLRI